MTKWFKTKGKVIYDPRRRNLRKTFKSRTMIIELPRDDLDLYYQWFLLKRYGSWFQTQRPMWGKHITIVRGDESGYLSPNWGKHEGEMIEVYYNPAFNNKWKFWSLPVKPEGLEELRFELGLTVKHDFHITFARQYDWQPELRKQMQTKSKFSIIFNDDEQAFWLYVDNELQGKSKYPDYWEYHAKRGDLSKKFIKFGITKATMFTYDYDAERR